MTRELTHRQPTRVEIHPFDRLFTGLFSRDPFFSGLGVPSSFEQAEFEVDVSENDEQVLVRASVPGFKRDDISVDIHEGVLTISATMNEEAEEHTERYHRRERRTGSMSRRVTLPVPVNEENAEASLNDGVLELRLPKNGSAGPKRIAIS